MTAGWSRLFWCLALFLAIASLQPGFAQEGRIGVLYAGGIMRSAPFREMVSDPLFSITFVSASLRGFGGWEIDDVQRAVRMYMPRTYERIREFDAIVLGNANRFAVGSRKIEMMARSVREGGLSLLMSGGWESFGGVFGRPSWSDTAIAELLPTEDVIDTWVQYPRGYLLLEIDQKNHELMGSVAWHGQAEGTQNMWRDFHHNLVKLRQGATLLAHVRSLDFENHPAMVTWELDNGARTFSLTGEIHTFSRPNVWEYSLDFGSNLMIYLDGRPVPQDLELIHTVRQKMVEVRTRKSLLLGLLDFCNSVGANTEEMMARIDSVDNRISGIMPDYLGLRFQKVLEVYQEVEIDLEEMERDAIKLKDRALLWVYIIEWLSVTGVGMACGFFLWSVMIRRRLYRTVGTTRLYLSGDKTIDR